MAKHTRTRGQALAEFALVAPFFFLLLFSIIEFGRAAYYLQMLNNAAREGARYAIVHGASSGCPSGPMPPTTPVTPNPCDPNGDRVVSAAKQHAIGVIDAAANAFDVDVLWCASGLDVDTCDDDLPAKPQGTGSNARGDYVKVTITYTFQPLIGGFVPLPSFTLTGGSILVVNH